MLTLLQINLYRPAICAGFFSAVSNHIPVRWVTVDSVAITSATEKPRGMGGRTKTILLTQALSEQLLEFTATNDYLKTILYRSLSP
ncbi:hypothetical protein R537_11350 [Salmonella enterica subsp. enterica serovar Rough O:d:1,7]|uniref:Uncharacterized protein n=1 Tax=Salmonella enterica subsp. enterica serovar Rough O:d:1,7 TaxID=1974323 RepID=A0A974KHS2_SALET|nr:hypothetical protein R537_11350 [Salmonella enterica subsp. enterica serovar Rough O:d:1,7]